MTVTSLNILVLMGSLDTKHDRHVDSCVLRRFRDAYPAKSIVGLSIIPKFNCRYYRTLKCVSHQGVSHR